MDAARRRHRRPHAVSRSQRACRSAPHGLRLRRRGALSLQAQRRAERKPGPATLHAKVDWLVCREAAFPARPNWSSSRPVRPGPAAAADPPDRDICERLTGTLPKPLPARRQSSIPTHAAGGFRLDRLYRPARNGSRVLPRRPGHPRQPRPAGCHAHGQRPHSRSQERREPHRQSSQFKAFSSSPAAAPMNDRLPAPRNCEAGSVRASPAPAVAPAPSSTSPRSPLTPATPLPSASCRLPASLSSAACSSTSCPASFPCSSSKASRWCKSGHEERHKLRAHGFVYTAGILVSFWVLVAVLLGLRAAGATLGWGFQFQSPVFLVADGRAALLPRPFARRPV